MPTSASSTPPQKDLSSDGISTHVPASVPIQPGVSPSGPTAETHFFGLRQDAAMHGFHTQAFSDDYDKRFPEDPYCKETAPNARVWRMYVEEAAAYDANLVGQSRDGLDVMLVFAGLFSAVVTSFLVQISQNLQADYAQMSAVLLHDLIFVQLSLADGVPAANITRPSVNPAQTYVADGITVWVNGLWVVSLTASLVVALIAVLAKQWLHHYVSPPSGTPRLRSHIRQFRFMGLERWHVRIIIGILPIIMHISLTLFLSGLILYFIPLRQALAWTVAVITIVVFLLYFIANAMPFFSPQCPYKTLLTEAIYGLHKYYMLLYSSLPSYNRQDMRVRGQSPAPRPLHTMMEAETDAVFSDRDTLSIDAFDWMFNVSSNPSVRSIVLQALGGLPSRVLAYTKVKWPSKGKRATEMAMARYQLVRGYLRGVGASQDCLECLPGYEATFERLTRSLVFLPDENYKELLDNRFRSPPNAGVPFQATRVLLATRHRKDSIEPIDQETLFNFFLSNHEVGLHSLVWEELMRVAISIHIFNRCQSNPALGPSYAQLMMLLASPSKEDRALMRRRRLNGTEQLVTLSVAMRICPTLESVIWNDILASPMLRPFNNRGSALSSRMRFLIAAGKFALYGMQDMPTAAQSRCYLRLLEHILRLFLEDYQWLGATDAFTFRDSIEMQDFIISTVKKPSVCGPRSMMVEGTDMEPLQLQKSCLTTIIELYHNYSLWEKSFSFPSLHIIMQFSVWFLNATEFSPARLPSNPSHLIDTCQTTSQILACALSRGREEAYHLFIDAEWMDVMSPLWIFLGERPPQDLNIVAEYIIGLRLIRRDSDSARQTFIQHLHTPRNLVICFLTVYFNDVALRRLIELDPGHPSWVECRHTMRAILDWWRSPSRSSSDFPLRDFYGQRTLGSVSFRDGLENIFLQCGIGGLESAIEYLESTIDLLLNGTSPFSTRL